jgi:hypothetical protein
MDGGGEKGHTYGAEIYVPSTETLTLTRGKGMKPRAVKRAAEMIAKSFACGAGRGVGAAFVNSEPVTVGESAAYSACAREEVCGFCCRGGIKLDFLVVFGVSVAAYV